jgi:hypothetical protein
MPKGIPNRKLIGTEDGNQDDMQLNMATGEVSGIEVIPENEFADKAAEESFMNERVVIHIESGDHENEPLFVHTGHNGDTQYVMRGTDQPVRRRYLYSLMIAKVIQLKSSFGIRADGKEFNDLKGPSRNTHRFYIVEDTAAGRAWFQREIARL